MSNTVVALRPAEWTAAASLGEKREALRKSRGVEQTFAQTDAGGSLEKRNRIGAVAEYALAKHYGLTRLWCETQAYSENHWTITSDVGFGVQVRATDRPQGTLWGYTYDKGDWQAYVLARVEQATHSVACIGWLYGAEVKNPAYWNLLKWTRPAFNVPTARLRPMDTLPKDLIYGPHGN